MNGLTQAVPARGVKHAGPATVCLDIEPLAELARKMLRELPGDAPGARPARDAPFERLAHELVVGELQLMMRRVPAHHVEVLVLAAVVKAEPQAEAVGKRDLLLHRFG